MIVRNWRRKYYGQNKGNDGLWHETRGYQNGTVSLEIKKG
ncbi:MAG: Hypothetical protein LKU_01753 [Lactobacillus kefiranofaciens]